MVFSEIYGSYFAITAEILTHAVEGTLTDKMLEKVVADKGFAESVLTLPKAMKEDWPLVTWDLQTPLRHVPVMPLTTLQKRWLKALLLDKRIRLFEPPMDGLDDVEPLFTPEMFDHFDRYDDGDPYEDAEYIAHFKLILQSLKEKRCLLVRFHGNTGRRNSWRCVPKALEYSSKDDKFRMIANSSRGILTVNLASIFRCELLDTAEDNYHEPETRKSVLVMELKDERNTLERAMLHFSHFEKVTERCDGNYLITMKYNQDDEAELLIRVLSFGPMIKVLSPESFIAQIRGRLKRQAGLKKT